MPDSPCLVAIGAHAADVEFSSGATLLVHARQGWDCHIIHLTLGEKGNPRMSPEEYGAQKRQEAEAAAQALGATPHFLPFADAELTADDATAQPLAALLRKLRPSAIITHWPGSIHADHTAAHDLTDRAIFMACNPHFDLEGLPRMGWARLWFAENWEDPEGFRPFIYVDVGDVMEEWQRAFACYAIGRGEGGYPYWDRYEAQTRIRGIEIGVSYAQAFSCDESALRQRRQTL